MSIPPPDGPVVRDYYTAANEEQQAKITDIVTSLATKDYWTLLWDLGRLTTLGEEIRVLHPMRFMLHIVEDSELDNNLTRIFQRTLVWPRFWGPTRQSLDDELTNGGILEAHTDHFATVAQLDHEMVRNHVFNREWDHLIQHVIDTERDHNPPD